MKKAFEITKHIHNFSYEDGYRQNKAWLHHFLLNQLMNHLHPTISEFSSPFMRGGGGSDEEEEEEEEEQQQQQQQQQQRKEEISSITFVPKHGVTDTISPPLHLMTRIFFVTSLH
jgi:hypothetical protein